MYHNVQSKDFYLFKIKQSTIGAPSAHSWSYSTYPTTYRAKKKKAFYFYFLDEVYTLIFILSHSPLRWTLPYVT